MKWQFKEDHTLGKNITLKELELKKRIIFLKKQAE